MNFASDGLLLAGTAWTSSEFWLQVLVWLCLGSTAAGALASTRTAWVRSRPLGKFVAYAVVAHVGLLALAYATHLNYHPGGYGNGYGVVSIHLRGDGDEVEDADDLATANLVRESQIEPPPMLEAEDNTPPTTPTRSGERGHGRSPPAPEARARAPRRALRAGARPRARRGVRRDLRHERTAPRQRPCRGDEAPPSATFGRVGRRSGASFQGVVIDGSVVVVGEEAIVGSVVGTAARPRRAQKWIRSRRPSQRGGNDAIPAGFEARCAGSTFPLERRTGGGNEQGN